MRFAGLLSRSANLIGLLTHCTKDEVLATQRCCHEKTDAGIKIKLIKQFLDN